MLIEVSKDRFSAFLHGACDLSERLRDADIDTVVIAGTVTNVCCESSARDAMMRNFHVIMAADANAALTDEDHNASLTALAQTFADDMDVDTISAVLRGEARVAEATNADARAADSDAPVLIAS